MKPFARPVQSGVSLVESSIVLAISSILIGLTVPGFDQMRGRAHLRGTTAQLETDLQFARSSAVALNKVVHFSFDERETGTCYLVHTGGPRDCSCGADGRPQCIEGVHVLRSALIPASTGLTLSSNSADLGFEPIRGMVTPTATMSVRNRALEQANVVINIMGRVRTCSPTRTLVGEVGC